VYRDPAYTLKGGDEICLLKEIKQVDNRESSSPSQVQNLDPAKLQGISKRLQEMILFENEHLLVISKDHGVPA